MMPSATPMLPRVVLPGPVRVRWFSGGGSVEDFGEDRVVRVRGVLVGQFSAGDTGARNAILVGLAAEPRMHLGQLAKAFRISEEMLRRIRRRYERDGLLAVVTPGQGGKEPVVDAALREELAKLFEAKVSVSDAHARVQKTRTISRATVGAERLAWTKRRAESNAATVPGPTAAETAQLCLPPVDGSQDPSTVNTAQSETAPYARVRNGETRDATPTRETPAAEVSPNARVRSSVETCTLVPSSGRLHGEALARGATTVQHAGAWLLLAQLARYPLHPVAAETCARAGLDGRTVRLAIDAVAVALAQGERCVEGVRRLATLTAPLLLSADSTPSVDWVRTTLHRLAEVGADALHAGVMRRTLALARTDSGPAVFWVDGHYLATATMRRLRHRPSR